MIVEKKYVIILEMEKTCVINPISGRAVKIDSRLGKKIIANKKNVEDQAASKLQAVVRRKHTNDINTKIVEIPDKKPRSKKKSDASAAAGTKVVKKYPEKDKDDAVKKLQAVFRRKSTPTFTELKKKASDLNKKIKSIKTDDKSDDIIKSIKLLIGEYNDEDFENKLQRFEEGGREFERFGEEYINFYNKQETVLIRKIDNLEKTQREKLIKNKSVTNFYNRELAEAIVLKYQEYLEILS
jgi:hypothetical protein